MQYEYVLVSSFLCSAVNTNIGFIGFLPLRLNVTDGGRLSRDHGIHFGDAVSRIRLQTPLR